MTVNEVNRRYKLRHLLPVEYLIRNFAIHVYNPYKDQIMKKDETFFLDSDISECEIDDVDGYSGNDIKGIVDILKKIWVNASDDTKDKLWMRIQILIKLCEKWDTE
jgi:hypothetical protein